MFLLIILSIFLIHPVFADDDILQNNNCFEHNFKGRANLVDGAKCTPVYESLGPGEDQKDTDACVVKSINDIFYCCCPKPEAVSEIVYPISLQDSDACSSEKLEAKFKHIEDEIGELQDTVNTLQQNSYKQQN